jgi:hypothetical protein
MFDFRRLREILMVLTCISIALIACRLFQALFVNRWPAWLPKSDWTFSTIASYDRAGTRLAGVLAEAHEPGTRFAVSLGSSTIEAAVTPEIWDTASPSHRWVHLAGNAVYSDGLRGMGQIISESSLRPDLVVIGLNLGLLSQSDNYLDPFMNDNDQFTLNALMDHLKTRQFRSVKQDIEELLVVPMNQVFPGRNRAGTAGRYVALEARLALFRFLGVRSEVLFRPGPTPWKVSHEAYGGPRPTEAALQYQFLAHERRGWFNPNNYAASRSGFVSFVQLVRRLRSTGAEVVLVLLPDSSRVRAAVPVEAERSLRTVLDENFRQDAPPVFDLRKSVSDDKFFDVVHVNPEGSQIFSRQFAKELKTWLGTKGR